MVWYLISRYAILVFVACFVGIAAALVMVVRSYREGKSAPFSYVRDTAMVRAQRAMYVVILFFLIAVGMAGVLALTSPPPTAVSLAPPPSPTPTRVPTLMLPSATHTPLPPSPTPSPAPTREPTATPIPTALPPSPTLTLQPPSPTPSPLSPSPTPTLVPPSPTPSPLPPSATPTSPPPSPTLTPRPVSTPTTTSVPTSTPELATATSIAVASPTLAPTVETPMPTATPAMVALAVPSGAGFGEIVFSRDISADNQPLEAGTVFAAGSEPVYVFFEYRGLSNGVLWTQAWYREGEEMWRDTGPWQWGSRGRAWFFYTPPSGYTPGNYEVRLYIGDELQQTGMFIVR